MSGSGGESAGKAVCTRPNPPKRVSSGVVRRHSANDSNTHGSPTVYVWKEVSGA